MRSISRFSPVTILLGAFLLLACGLLDSALQ
jgi:hypothetical protein